MKTAVILFNLGGPDAPEAIAPFLKNLFSDPAILRLPAPLRLPLAWLIATRRAPVARGIYGEIGGKSPILPQTLAQADALETALGKAFKCFIAMRYWHPFADEAVQAVKEWGAERLVLLPLYPQFSTTTTASSLRDWRRAAKAHGLALTDQTICCYPDHPGLIAAFCDLIRSAQAKRQNGVAYRLLLTAHGLPERVIRAGDPYQTQVEQTAAAIVGTLGITDYSICYQSRVGPLKWIGPATDVEIRRAGDDGLGVIVVPVAFVSEHSETLVELDIEYAKLASEVGVKDYIRVPTVSTHPSFIGALADLVRGDLVGSQG